MSHDVSDFALEVIERSRTVPVVVDFWAEWCGPCKILGPVLERLEAKSGGRWELAKVDTDKYQDLAGRYGIRGIPNVKMFIDGAVADEFTGALPERAVAQWLEKVLPEKYRSELGEAERLMGEGKTADVHRLLAQVLAKDPDNHHAGALMGRALLFTAPEEAARAVRGIEEDSEYFPLADAVRTVSRIRMAADRPETLPDDDVKEDYLAAARDLASQNFRGAIEGFIGVIRRNRRYDDDGARKACIAIFRILGEDHEMTRSYRRDFGSALNV